MHALLSVCQFKTFFVIYNLWEEKPLCITYSNSRRSWSFGWPVIKPRSGLSELASICTYFGRILCFAEVESLFWQEPANLVLPRALQKQFPAEKYKLVFEEKAENQPNVNDQLLQLAEKMSASFLIIGYSGRKGQKKYFISPPTSTPICAQSTAGAIKRAPPGGLSSRRKKKINFVKCLHTFQRIGHSMCIYVLFFFSIESALTNTKETKKHI